MFSSFISILVVAASIAPGQATLAVVLDPKIYRQITIYCNSYFDDYVGNQMSPSDQFVQAPSYIVTPYDVLSAFKLYTYLSNNNFSAVVSPYSSFIPSIVTTLNMLYYVYDYEASSSFNDLMEQVGEFPYQIQSSQMNNNVKVAFSYYYLLQVANQLMFSPQDDPILSQFSNSPVFYIICETASDAQSAISTTFGQAMQPVIIALDSYIGNPALTNCQSTQMCNQISCAELCQIYNMVYAIQQGISGGYNATVFVALTNATQLMYLPTIAAYGLQLGLFAQNVLWILAELWLPPSQLVSLLGVAAPIYVISVPAIDVSPLQDYICNDFIVQMDATSLNGDTLPCDLSKSPSWFCDPSYGWFTNYKGFMPSSLAFKVRRLPFNSNQFFTQVIMNSAADPVNYTTMAQTTYYVNALPTQSEYQGSTTTITTSTGTANAKQTLSTWLPGKRNCNTTILKQYSTPLRRENLLNTTSLANQAVYTLGVLYEPLMMRRSNYDAINQSLVKKTLINHGFTSSLVIQYPTELGCEDYNDNGNFQWCFYNASAYNIQPDSTYNNALALAYNFSANSTLQICNLTLLVPFMDNVDMYTGFSIDLLSLLRTNMNISVHITESSQQITSIPAEMANSSKYAMSAVHLLVNGVSNAYVDFTSPSTTTGVNIIMNNQTYDSSMQVLYPFGYFAWLLIVASILLLSSTFFLIDRISKNEKTYYSFMAMFSYTFASYTQGAVDLTPKRLSARVLSMFMWFGVMLLLSSYTSAMSVVLLSPPSSSCVDGLFDLLKCGVMFNAAPNSIAVLMLADSRYSNLSQNYKFNDYFPQITPYFNQDNNYSNYKHFAHIGDSAFNRYYYAKYCSYMNISLIGQPQYIQFRAFALPKEAKFGSSVDAGLLNITTSGNKTIITQNWFPDPPTSCTFSTNAKALSFGDMAGLFYILFIGCGVSIFSLVFEVLRSRYIIKKQSKMAPQLEFGQVYEAAVATVLLEGVEIDIKAQPKRFFIPYENLNLGNVQLQFASELGIKVGSVIYVKYFGKDSMTKSDRFVLIKIEETENAKSNIKNI